MIQAEDVKTMLVKLLKHKNTLLQKFFIFKFI